MACHTTWVTSICWLNLTYANKSTPLTPNLASFRESSFPNGEKRFSLTKMTHDHYCGENCNYLRYIRNTSAISFSTSLRSRRGFTINRSLSFSLSRKVPQTFPPSDRPLINDQPRPDAKSCFLWRTREIMNNRTDENHWSAPTVSPRVINDPAASAIPPWSQTEKRSGLRSLIGFDAR